MHESTDVLIVTAIQLEFEAVLRVDTGAVPGSRWERRRDRNGLPYALRGFVAQGATRPLRVAVTCAADMGSEAVTNVAVPLLAALKPGCIAMCGVCAGRPGKTALGDVIAAERLFFWDTGKRIGKVDAAGEVTRTVEQDIKTYLLRPEWKQALDETVPARDFAGAAWLAARPVPIAWQELRVLAWVAANPERDPPKAWSDEHCPEWKRVIRALWDERGLLDDGTMHLTAAGRALLRRCLLENGGELPDLSPFAATLPFRLHVAPFASGSQVVEDETIWGFISAAMRKTLGLEMEAAAIGAIAHYQRAYALDAIVMKGVMDFAEHGRDDHFKEFAARASAECLIAFLRRKLVVEVVPGVDDDLTDGRLPRPLEPTAAQLLDARYEFVRWHAGPRASLLDELDAWADGGPDDVSVRLVHADGGIGKTRLAIEWIRRRRQRRETAGFLVKEPSPQWFAIACAPGSPVTIVIDYSESRANLGEMLERLANYNLQPDRKRRVRVLLLARNAGDWWDGLRRRSAGLTALLEQVKPMTLAPMAMRAADRLEVFVAATRRFAELRHKDAGPPAPIELVDDRYERVLYLHMAALATVEGVAFTADSLIDVILDHEERFWLYGTPESDEGDERHEARQCVVAATLRGGYSLREPTQAALGRVLGRQGDLGDRQHRLISRLHAIYAVSQRDSRYLPGLEPDLLGEAMVRRLAEPPIAGDRVPAAWIDRVFDRDDAPETLRIAFTVLGRASTRETKMLVLWMERLLAVDLHVRAPEALEAVKLVGRRTAFSPLGEVLARRLADEGTVALAHVLRRVGMPHATVSLVGVAAWVARTLYEEVLAGEGEAVLAERAERAFEQGSQLLATGQREAALGPAQEAVDMFRVLAASWPGVFRKGLAKSLAGLCNNLRDLKRPSDALGPILESIELYRDLVRVAPDVHPANLARCLASLANILHGLGRHEEALEPAQETVDIRRMLAERDRERFPTFLGKGLMDLAICLRSLKRSEEALKHIREAVEIYREATKHRPAESLSDFAYGLLILGRVLGDLNQPVPAFEAAWEATSTYRALTEQGPDRFQPLLAESLNGLGNQLRQLGRLNEALAATQEGVDMFRALVARNRDVFLSGLAQALNNLSVRLADLGRHEDALKLSEEAVSEYRVLVRRNPDAFLPDLAGCLNNMSLRLNALGRQIEALAISQEAVDTRRVLVARRRSSTLFRADLADALKHFSDQLGASERREEALAASREAVRVLRELAKHEPNVYTPRLAACLGGLSNLLNELGHRDEGLRASEEATELHLSLKQRPQMTQDDPNVGMERVIKNHGIHDTQSSACD